MRIVVCSTATVICNFTGNEPFVFCYIIPTHFLRSIYIYSSLPRFSCSVCIICERGPPCTILKYIHLPICLLISFIHSFIYKYIFRCMIKVIDANQLNFLAIHNLKNTHHGITSWREMCLSEKKKKNSNVKLGTSGKLRCYMYIMIFKTWMCTGEFNLRFWSIRDKSSTCETRKVNRQAANGINSEVLLVLFILAFVVFCCWQM